MTPQLIALHRIKYNNREMASTTETCCEIAIAESNKGRREYKTKRAKRDECFPLASKYFYTGGHEYMKGTGGDSSINRCCKRVNKRF